MANSNITKLKRILSKFADLIREAEGTSDPIFIADMKQKVAKMDIAKFNIINSYRKYYCYRIYYS